MTSNRWQQVEELLHGALKRIGAERAAYLQAGCAGDGTLRREVELLLDAHEQAGSFIESPAIEVAARAIVADQVGPVVGLTLNHFKILSRLGVGGMGVVYLAEDMKLGRKVAVKVLPSHLTQDKDRLRRFKQETCAASVLNHPNIVMVHEIGEAEVGHFIVMEFVEGRALRAFVGERPSLDSLVHWGRQMAQALAAAHATGVVHRDIKPENIMVRDDGYVKLLDFGLARLSSAVSDSDVQTATHTTAGTVLGTVRYMSPEQGRGEELTCATDIFSLGIVLYEVATGKHPFRTDLDIGTLEAILSESALPPSRLNPEIPAALDALILQMLEKDPRLRPDAADVDVAWGEISRRHTHPSATPPILVGKSHTVGREKERAELWAAFEVVKAGRGMMLCVSGEPGIGKTTLVEDFLTELKAQGAAGAVARGKCSERLAGTEAYLPLLEALDTLLHGQHNQSLARVLKLLAPSWYAQVVPLSGEHEESARFLNEISAASQERRKRELGQFLQEVARMGPAILFFDDLHWADVSTVDILAYLASRFDSLRVLIVTTFRPADLLLAKHPFLAVKRELEAHAQCREISLEFLSRLDIERYLSLEFPEHQFPSELSKLIHARTEGNPLFMADLVRYLCDREVIIRVDGRWTQARTLEAIEHELPASVRSMIERKIDRLSKEDRQLMVAASVQGYEFDSAVLSKVLGLDTAEVEEQLEALERVHAFVRLVSEDEFPNRTLTLRYRFVHVLYQNALYASLQPTRKTRLAAAVARALEGYWGEQSANVAGELAVLWEAAREFGRAADYFRLAAQNASRFFAAHEAVALAGRGLAMIQTLPDTRDNKDRELSLHVVLGTNLIATKGYCGLEVERTYSRAFELCHEVVETPHLLPVLYGLWSIHIVKSKHRKAWELGKEFLDRARRQGDPAVVVGHRLVGSPLFGLGELTQAREHFEKCVSAYAPAQHRSLTWLYGQDPGMVGHVWLGWTLWLLGYPERALVHSHRSLHLSQDVSHAHSQAYALFTTAVHHQFRRESQRVHDLAKAAMELAAEQKLAYWLGMAMCPDGWARAQQGQAAEGIDMQRRGLDAVRTTGVGFIVPYFLCLLAETYGKAGEAGAGLAVLTEALALIEENEERFWEAELYRLRGELLLKEGAACDDVEQSFHQAIAIARRQNAKSLELRAAMSLSCLRQKQGWTEEAGQVLAEIFSWFAEGFDTADLKEARVLLEEYDRTTPS